MREHHTKRAGTPHQVGSGSLQGVQELGPKNLYMVGRLVTVVDGVGDEASTPCPSAPRKWQCLARTRPSGLYGEDAYTCAKLRKGRWLSHNMYDFVLSDAPGVQSWVVRSCPVLSDHCLLLLMPWRPSGASQLAAVNLLSALGDLANLWKSGWLPLSVAVVLLA